MDVRVYRAIGKRAVVAALVALIAVVAAVTAVDLKARITVRASEAGAGGVAGALKIGLQPGSYPPDFTLPSVSGETVSLSQFRGEKPVLLNLWSFTCVPCRQELNELKALYPGYSDRVEILAVHVSSWVPRSYVAELASDMDLPFTVLVDEISAVATLYRVTAVPANYFINRQGIIRNVIIGGLDRERLKAEMDLLLE